MLNISFNNEETRIRRHADVRDGCERSLNRTVEKLATRVLQCLFSETWPPRHDEGEKL